MESAMKKGSSTESQGRTDIVLFRFAFSGPEQHFLHEVCKTVCILWEQYYEILNISF